MTGKDGWDWFDATPPAPLSDDAARLFTGVFGQDAGARALEMLRGWTVDRTLPPDASEAALRDLEGQRRLVRMIQGLVARGRKGET